MVKIFNIRILLLVPLFFLFAACSKDTPSPGEGSVAPDFVMKDLSGKSVRLSDLRGTVVLLNFWATWCPPCREEVPSLSRLNSALAGKDFRMLTVSIDQGGRSAVESFFSRIGYRLPTMPDADGLVANLYGVSGVPQTLIIDRKGVIRKKIMGGQTWDDPAIIAYISGLESDGK